MKMQTSICHMMTLILTTRSYAQMQKTTYAQTRIAIDHFQFGFRMATRTMINGQDLKSLFWTTWRLQYRTRSTFYNA